MFFSLPDLTVESCTIRFTSFCMLSKRRMSYPTGMKCSYRYSTPGFLSSTIWIFDFHSKFSHTFFCGKNLKKLSIRRKKLYWRIFLHQKKDEIETEILIWQKMSWCMKWSSMRVWKGPLSFYTTRKCYGPMKGCITAALQ